MRVDRSYFEITNIYITCRNNINNNLTAFAKGPNFFPGSVKLLVKQL